MKKTKVKFDLPVGARVKDDVEMVEGVITSRMERLNGAKQYFVNLPRTNEGKSNGYWSDKEHLQMIDKDPVKNTVAEFMFETGDRVKNLVTGKIGIITARKEDVNKCVGYWFENGEQNPRSGDIIEFFAQEPELQLVDKGLNIVQKDPVTKKKIEPIKRASTGSANIQSSGKYD